MPDDARRGRNGIGRWLSWIGPGVVTGASDDDPSGIATYAQAGAVFGFGMLWTALFTFPLMTVIQEVSARIGRVTGKGIAANMRAHYPRAVLYVSVFLLLVANTLNIGADLGAMGAALELLFHVNPVPLVIILAFVCVYLEVFLPYRSYVPILQWLVLVLLAYVLTAFVTAVPWREALLAAFIPSFPLNRQSLTMLIAILGTTISPYLFFWQSAQEVEEIRTHRFIHALLRFRHGAADELRKLRADTFIGMAFSNLITFFIILTTGATLHLHGVTEIRTAADAAAALQPLAGPFASFLFAAGVVGTGFLAIPVLAGSAAFAVGETLRWPVGLERRALKAKGFYAVIAVATLVGLLLNFFGIDPIRALIAVAVINGIVSVPIMALIMHMSGNRKVMGSLVSSPQLRAVGWLTTLMVAAASLGFFLML